MSVSSKAPTKNLLAIVAINEIDSIKITQADLARELGLLPKSVSAMKKSNPVRFKLLMDGLRCSRLRDVAEKG